MHLEPFLLVFGDEGNFLCFFLLLGPVELVKDNTDKKVDQEEGTNKNKKDIVDSKSFRSIFLRSLRGYKL